MGGEREEGMALEVISSGGKVTGDDELAEEELSRPGIKPWGT